MPAVRRAVPGCLALLLSIDCQTYRVATKWLDFGGAGEGGSAWVEYRLLGEGAAASATLLRYDLVSAEDCPERDPSTWVLEGWPGPSEGADVDAGV